MNSKKNNITLYNSDLNIINLKSGDRIQSEHCDKNINKISNNDTEKSLFYNKKILTYLDVIDFFKGTKDKNTKLFFINNHYLIFECNIALISLIDSDSTYENLYKDNNKYICFLTYKLNEHYLLPLNDNEKLFKNDNTFNFDSDKYLIELHFIALGETLEEKYLNYYNNYSKKSPFYYFNEESYNIDESKISFIDKINSKYKRFILPRSNCTIHNGNKYKVKKQLIQIYNNGEMNIKNGLLEKLNGFFIDLIINNETLILEKINDYKIKERILMFDINKKNSCFEDAFGYLKYCIFFSNIAVTNYITKYLVNIVFLFTHTSETLLDFFSKIGVINNNLKNKENNKSSNIYNLSYNNYDYNINFFLKSDINRVYSLIDNNIKKNLIQNLSQLKNNPKNSYKSCALIHKFIPLKSKLCNSIYLSNTGLSFILPEKNSKNNCTQSTSSNINSNNKNKDSSKKSSFDLTVDENYNKSRSNLNYDIFIKNYSTNTRIKKFNENLFYHDLLKNMLIHLGLATELINFNKFINDISYDCYNINKFNLSLLNPNYEIIKNRINLFNFEELYNNFENFINDSLSKSIIKHITQTGFTNIDVISNEDNMIDLNCCFTKRKNKCVNNCLENSFDCGLNLINKIFNLNEGFFHKHISILGSSYNFNHTNTVETLKTENDYALRNKLRVFDVLFLPEWSKRLSKIVLELWKYKFQLFNNEFINYSDLQKNNSNYNFLNLDIKKLLYIDFEIIIQEYFDVYSYCLPDFLSFSLSFSDYVKKEYNMIDNVCQHFANNSLNILLKDNITNYTLLYKKYNKNLEYQVIPLFDRILEPYFIHIDSLYEKYQNYWSNKQAFINIELIKYEKTKEFKIIDYKDNKKKRSENFDNTNISQIKIPRKMSSVSYKTNFNYESFYNYKKYSNNLNNTFKEKMLNNNELEKHINDLALANNDKIHWYLVKSNSNDFYTKSIMCFNEAIINNNVLKEDINYKSNNNDNYNNFSSNKLNRNKISCVKKTKNFDTNYYYNLTYLFNLSYFYSYRLNHKLLEDCVKNRLASDNIDKLHISNEDKLFFSNNFIDFNYTKTSSNIFRNLLITRTIINKTKNMCLGYYDYVCSNMSNIISEINSKYLNNTILNKDNNLSENISYDCYVRIGWLTANLKCFK